MAFILEKFDFEVNDEEVSRIKSGGKIEINIEELKNKILELMQSFQEKITIIISNGRSKLNLYFREVTDNGDGIGYVVSQILKSAGLQEFNVRFGKPKRRRYKPCLYG